MESQSQLVRVAGKDELADGQTKVVRVKANTLALFRLGGEYFAMSNTCLHRGGPLAEGEVTGFTVTCPWHGWTYDIRSGSFDLIPTLKVRTYPVKVVDGDVFVEVP